MKAVERKRKLMCMAAVAVISLASLPVPASAAESDDASASFDFAYADLADLAIAAELVIKAEIRKQATLSPERSPSLRPGWARLYIEAQTQALIAGNAPIGESLKYLVDVPLDANGKVPKLKKQSVLLFARSVPGRPGELQLVDVDAQIPADPQTEARTRAILTELASPDAPPQIKGVNDAISVAGNLAGESETQVFLDAEDGASVALSVIRRPGMPPEWGVSWTELVDQSAQAPQHGTLEWYRLACFLPDSLPPEAILSRDGASRVRAAQDYRLVKDELGQCTRNRLTY